ncbi:hypothetical protein DH2020_034135 [Rehmannia glutinosa]|uniref:Major facilitator superfamily (MFS) profile domain-containing protein n=1 Tax=Rehmannia glutinosa TaxID=99300 RepID=A0ABR0VAA9_REHGL
MAAKLGDHGGLSKRYGDVVLVLIGIYVAGFGISWGPLGWLIPSEIFPLEIRSAGQSVSVGVNFLFTFLVGQTFLSMLCRFKSGIFFFFGGWVAVMTGFVYLLLPETKNVPIEQMERAVPLYLSEMALPKYRGAISNGFQFSLGLGFLAANLTNYGSQKITGGWGWRVSLAMAALPASVLTLGALFLPETPNNIIQQNNDHEKAKRTLQRIRGTNDVQAELDDLIAASDVSKTMKNPYRNILRRNYRPQFVMSIAIPFFQIVTGINVIGFYAPILFRTIGLGESASLMSSVITGVVGSSTTLIAVLVVDKVGRRFLLILGGVVMFFAQMTVGGVMAAKLGDHGGLDKVYGYVVLAMISVYIAGFGLSWGPLGFLIPSEIFPLEIRSAGQSISVAVNFLFTFLVGQTFLSMLCHFKSGIFFFFGGWAAVMTVFVYFLLPETKNIPIEQMERIWREDWFWNRIVGDNEEVISKMDGA